MKNNNVVGYLAFLGLGMLFAWLLFGRSDINIDVEKYETQINILQEEINLLSSKNDSLQLEAGSLKIRISEYDDKIKSLNSRIYVIKQETKDKVDAVDLFGDDELERFFAKRYLIKTDSSTGQR
jgi:regulator of replication initiation timing